MATHFVDFAILNRTFSDTDPRSLELGTAKTESLVSAATLVEGLRASGNLVIATVTDSVDAVLLEVQGV